MRELQEQFDGKGQVRGYTFTQISKTEWGFIYEVEHGGHRHYEVFKKRLNHRFDTVSYPTDKAFGKWAWTCMSLDNAEERLKEIAHTSNISPDTPPSSIHLESVNSHT